MDNIILLIPAVVIMLLAVIAGIIEYIMAIKAGWSKERLVKEKNWLLEFIGTALLWLVFVVIAGLYFYYT